MNIAIFCDKSWPSVSGVADVVDSISINLVNYGHKVTVFCEPSKYDVNDSEKPYNIIRFLFPVELDPFSNFKYIDPLKFVNPKVEKCFSDKKFDIVYIHSILAQSFIGFILAKKYNIPLIAHCHCNYLMEIESLPYKSQKESYYNAINNIYNKSDLVIYTCESLKALMKDKLNVKNKSAIIDNASSLIHISNIKNSDKLILAYSGRVEFYQKNIKYSLDIIRRIKDKNIDVEFWIIGPVSDSNKNLILSYSKDIDIQDNIIFKDHISDKNTLSHIISETDALLFPSKYDTESIAVKDFARLNKPVILLENAICAQNKKDFVITINEDVDEASAKIIDIMLDSNLLDNYKNKIKNIDIKWDNIVKNQLIPQLKKLCR